MFYTIYKITNLINGKYYIGKHITKDLNDNYMGSGKLLKYALKKYGKENFVKEILEVYNNEKNMNLAEKILVVIDNEINYNLCSGGHGGFSFINKNKLSGGIVSDISKKNLKSGNNPWKNSPEHYKKLSNILKEKYPNGIWKNKKHTEESKQKLKNHKNQKGNKNSQFGTCWVTNNQENKKIKKEELDIWLNKGYSRGRIIKFLDP